MPDHILDDMDLPFSSENESLETISNNKLKPLFDTNKFEIRDEVKRDKGIDLSIEVKKEKSNGEIVYTNFRFVVQLKATSSRLKNGDGSISLSVKTSNINYLLNNGMPAYYILYDSSDDKFYLKHLNEFIHELEKSNPEWIAQANHTIRFHQNISNDIIGKIYEDTLKRGVLSRKISERILWDGVGTQLNTNIIISSDLQVSNDEEIMTLIEKTGFHLINEGRWNEIIEMHQRASGRVANSKLYNLILGTANYYTGYLMDAISFFRRAKLAEGTIDKSLEKHLKYFETSAKRIVGIINEDEYGDIITELVGEDDLGFHVLMEKYRMSIFKSEKSEIAETHITYIRKLVEIINNPKASVGVQLNAGAEKILFQGFYNNLQFVTSVASINGYEANHSPNKGMRAELAVTMIEANANWYKEVQELKDKAEGVKNWFAYFTIMLNEVQIRYKFYVYATQVQVKKEISEFDNVNMSDKIETMDVLLSMLDEAESFFSKVGHIQNISAVLASRYEIVHFLNKLDEADEILNKLEDIVETYDVKEQREKLSFLKLNGPTHVVNQKLLNDTVVKAEKIYEELEQLRNKMIEIDKNESEHNQKEFEDGYLIQLFPIGYFKFPKSKKDFVFDIIHASKDAQLTINNILLFGAIPIANIYYTKVEQEGFIDGKMADCGLDSWRNLYRVRKAFFDNGFQRIELNI